MVWSEFLIHAAMLGSVVCFGGGAILALAWAAENGQFRNFKRAAESIFDGDEPMGTPTDRVLITPLETHDHVG